MIWGVVRLLGGKLVSQSGEERETSEDGKQERGKEKFGKITECGRRLVGISLLTAAKSANYTLGTPLPYSNQLNYNFFFYFSKVNVNFSKIV